MKLLFLVAILLIGCQPHDGYSDAAIACTIAHFENKYSSDYPAFTHKCDRYSKSCIVANTTTAEQSLTWALSESCIARQPEQCISCYRQDIRYCWNQSCPFRYDAYYCCMHDHCEGDLYNDMCAREHCLMEQKELYLCPTTCSEFTAECFVISDAGTR